MTTRLICKLATPQDDRFSASGILTLDYLADESEKTIASDAKEIARRGQHAVDEMASEGIIKVPAGQPDNGCFVPQNFNVTIQFADGRTKAVKP